MGRVTHTFWPVFIYKISFKTFKILSPICVVETFPPRSFVLKLKPPASSSSRTRLTAASIARAGLSKPMEYLNSKAALRIVPTGLAIPCPAISGAEPWMGSYNPGVVLKSGELKSEIVGAPAREAEGNNPREPGMTLDSSESLVSSKKCQTAAKRICSHVPEQVLRQQNAVKFSRVRDDQHRSRVNQLMVQLNLRIFLF